VIEILKKKKKKKKLLRLTSVSMLTVCGPTGNVQSCKRTAWIAGNYLLPATRLQFCFFELPNNRTAWKCLRSYVIWLTDLLFNSNRDGFAKYVPWSRHFAGCYSQCLPHSGNLLILNFTTLSLRRLSTSYFWDPVSNSLHCAQLEANARTVDTSKWRFLPTLPKRL
jgi:hypothetical protein